MKLTIQVLFITAVVTASFGCSPSVVGELSGSGAVKVSPDDPDLSRFKEQVRLSTQNSASNAADNINSTSF